MLAKNDGCGSELLALDVAMMERCIELSAEAVMQGELPFAAIVCDEHGNAVVEVTNRVVRDTDITRHAELMAISEAQRVLKRQELEGCTLYSNVEPCPMCSFPVREARMSRVVFAIDSPMMGGYSKWNVLRDKVLSRKMPEAFGPAPEVIAGFMRDEAERVWRNWNPLGWAVIKHRGLLGTSARRVVHESAEPERGGLFRRLLRLHHR